LYNGSGGALVNSRNNVQSWNGDFSFSGAADLNLGTGAVTLSGTRTVTVTANILTINGVIGGASGYGLTKAGAGTLVLTTNNTYNGATTVSAGTLQLSGASGTILNSAVTTTGGALTLLNANGANTGNRVSDSAAFTMIGGTLNFNNDATANDFSESVGTLTLAGGANTVAIGQAASGRTSTLTFAGLSRTTGIINFSGTGLTNAVDNRSRITFTTPPALVNGIIGPWATVNGTAYATLDGANNVVAYSTYTDVARGTRVPRSSLTPQRLMCVSLIPQRPSTSPWRVPRQPRSGPS
jgi:autotransporter-associated beta strand protein